MCKSVSGIYKININNKCYIGSAVNITVSVTNQYGITTDYYCHRTYNVLGSGITIGVS